MNEENTYQLYTDGSYNQFTKLAGFGGYLIDSEGNTIFEFSEVITDPKLKKHHEALSLEKGLTLCLNAGIKSIQSYTDAKQMALVCNTKDKKVRKIYTDRTPILKRISTLIDEFDNISFNYLPRRFNYRADILSHKAVNEMLKNNKSVGETFFTSTTIDFSKNYEDKKEFIDVCQQINDFIIIDSNSKNKEIKTYYLKRDKKGIVSFKLINTIPNNNNTGMIAQSFYDALLHMKDVKKCVIYARGGYAHAFESILKSVIPFNKIEKSSIDKFKLLEQVLNNFQKVVYHFDIDIMNKVFITSMKKNKAQLIEALEILGNDNYVLGQNKEIESYFTLKRNQKENIGRIQQKYFDAFLKISLKDPILKEKLHPNIRMQQKEQKIFEIKEELEQRGIKLKIS